MRAHKEGYVREDGMVYWRYHKDRGHVWITKEKYQQYIKTRVNYRKIGLEEYYRRREKIDPMDRSYYGKYSFQKNRYFIGLSVSGKEVWTTKEKFLKHKEQKNKNSKKFLEKLKMQAKSNLKMGDPHPENSDLVVCFFIGNKPYFGSKEKLNRVLESRKISYRKRNIKYRKIRTEKLAKMENRLKRGAVHPENGTLFWEYNCRCKEVWLSVEKFYELQNIQKERRKRSRLKKKEESNV
jgi:hypothetical protein